MKMLLTAIALTTAAPAAAQTAAAAQPSHAGHANAPASPGGKADARKAADAKHPAGCHMMNGKMMAMKNGKMVPCPEKKSAGKPAADPHAGHDMNKH